MIRIFNIFFLSATASYWNILKFQPGPWLIKNAMFLSDQNRLLSHWMIKRICFEEVSLSYRLWYWGPEGWMRGGRAALFGAMTKACTILHRRQSRSSIPIIIIKGKLYYYYAVVQDLVSGSAHLVYPIWPGSWPAGFPWVLHPGQMPFKSCPSYTPA